MLPPQLICIWGVKPVAAPPQQVETHCLYTQSYGKGEKHEARNLFQQLFAG